MNLTAYLTSIVAVSIATIIVEIVLPESNVAKFTRKIIALIVVFVIIMPIPSLIKNKKISLNNINQNTDSYIDLNLISSINTKRAEVIEEQIETELMKNNIECNVDIPLDLTSYEFKISFVSVFVLNGNADIESIKNIVKKYVLINDEQIFIS